MKKFLLFVVDFLIFTALSMYYHKKTPPHRDDKGGGRGIFTMDTGLVSPTKIFKFLRGPNPV